MVCLSILAPTVAAAPTILPVSDSLVSITTSDTVTLFCGGTGAQAQTYVLRDPIGNEILFQRGTAPCVTATIPACAGGGSGPYATFSLDGTQVSGTTFATVNGDLIGDPADGTWVFRMASSGGFRVLLCTDGKLADYNYGAVPPARSCLYNWRTAGSSYVDDNNAPNCPDNADPVQDPNNAVFFSDADATNPTAATTHSTVTCPSTLTMNGVWARGASQSGNTFVKFYSVQGPAIEDSDLRDNIGVAQTPLVDDGASDSGDHSATGSYNNAAGTSYQFSARAGASGEEQLGSVLYAPPAQCTITPPNIGLGLIHEVILDVSQAQCAGDAVEFVVVIDISTLLTLNDMDVTIRDGFTNTAVLTVDDSEMYSNANGQIRTFNRTFPSGPWTAEVVTDVTGLGSVDFFDGKAFNVPQGTCIDSGLPNLENICSEDGNCAATGGGDLQLMGMDVQESWTFLLFLGFFLLGLWKGWWFVSGVASLGMLMAVLASVANVFHPNAAFMLLLLALWLELALEHRRQGNHDAPLAS